MGQSLWRGMMNKEFESIAISGRVLDLGGPPDSEYSVMFKGEYDIVCTDFDPEKETDLSFDFEKPFPVEEGSFNAILCINVLEHIFKYQNLLNESHRILKEGGTMVTAVPFLIRVHPSPNDYWRYTEQTLLRIFTEAGFNSVEIRPIGTGVCGASYALIHSLLRFRPIQAIGMTFAKMSDRILSHMAPTSIFTKKNYPLGYIVIAHKD